MYELDRRSILKFVAALSLGSFSSIADEQKNTVHLVEAGTDRTGQPHKATRANSHLDFKVLTHESSGALFIMENRNMIRGGGVLIVGVNDRREAHLTSLEKPLLM